MNTTDQQSGSGFNVEPIDQATALRQLENEMRNTLPSMINGFISRGLPHNLVMSVLEEVKQDVNDAYIQVLVDNKVANAIWRQKAQEAAAQQQTPPAVDTTPPKRPRRRRGGDKS